MEIGDEISSCNSPVLASLKCYDDRASFSIARQWALAEAELRGSRRLRAKEVVSVVSEVSEQ